MFSVPAACAPVAVKLTVMVQIAFAASVVLHPLALKFVVEQQRVIAESDSTRTGEEASQIRDSDVEEAYADLCHALLNANEFLFVE